MVIHLEVTPRTGESSQTKPHLGYVLDTESQEHDWVDEGNTRNEHVPRYFCSSVDASKAGQPMSAEDVPGDELWRCLFAEVRKKPAKPVLLRQTRGHMTRKQAPAIMAGVTVSSQVFKDTGSLCTSPVNALLK